MIELIDSIEINTTTDVVYDWLMKLDENFTKWNSNHKKFEKISGGVEVGDQIYFEQCVGGVWYKIKGEISVKERDEDKFQIEFITMSGIGNIKFIGENSEGGCIFTHIETFGAKSRIIGSLVDFLLFKVLARKKANFGNILQDMKEDNVNLKRILEGGSDEIGHPIGKT
jgi:hypothetical protein